MLNKNNPLISIIVPIYNAEEYLPKCLDSIEKQDYGLWEAILVDDGSSDNSPAICDKYKKSDSRFIVVHKEQEGPSVARTVGCSKSTGQYILFLDADDWLSEQCLSKCINETRNNDLTDCVMFSYLRETEVSSQSVHVFPASRVYSKQEIVNEVHYRFFGLLNAELQHPERMENIVTCWGKLYRREIALKGEFVDLSLIGSAEDAIFNIYALDGCQKIVYLDECLYHYRKHLGTITSRYNPKLESQWNNLFLLMDSIIKKQNYPLHYSEALNNRITLSAISIGLNELSNPTNNMFGHIRIIRKYISTALYRKCIKATAINNMSLAWKIFFLFSRFKLCFFMYCILWYIKRRKGKENET